MTVIEIGSVINETWGPKNRANETRRSSCTFPIEGQAYEGAKIHFSTGRRSTDPTLIRARLHLPSTSDYENVSGSTPVPTCSRRRQIWRRRQ